MEDKRSRSNGHSWVGDEQLGLKGPSGGWDMCSCAQIDIVGWKRSNQARKGLVEVGGEQLRSNGHGWVGDEQSGSSDHGGGGTPAVVFELTQRGLETSGRARKDVVEV